MIWTMDTAPAGRGREEQEMVPGIVERDWKAARSRHQDTVDLVAKERLASQAGRGQTATPAVHPYLLLRQELTVQRQPVQPAPRWSFVAAAQLRSGFAALRRFVLLSAPGGSAAAPDQVAHEVRF
jgi:hypothetical protein